MKGQKGVTALSMVIVIIIIIIIASFSIFNGRDVVVEGNLASIKNEVKTMKNAVEQLSLDKSYMNGIIETTKIDNISVYNSRVGNNLVEGKDYYYLGFGDESISETVIQNLNDALDVRSVKNSYIISVEDAGEYEIYLVDGVRNGDKYYFSYKDIEKLEAK